MTIIQLKYFLAVCEYGKIRITSEQLHVSEPTISVSIKRLEEELGYPLFSRQKSQLLLTAEGHLLQEKAADVVESFDRLEREMHTLQQLKKSSPVICLGAPSTLGEHLCMNLITEFTKEFPMVRFELPAVSSVDAVRQVEEGKIDFAMCNQLAVNTDHVTFLPIIHSRLLGIVRQDHPFAGKDCVSPQMLKNEKLILISEKSMTAKRIIKWFQDSGVDPNVFMYSNRSRLTLSLIEQYNAVAFFVDDLMFNDEAQLFLPENIATFSLSSPISFTFGIIHKKGIRLSMEHQRFFDFCNEYRQIK